MARPHRIWFPGATYHITARGNRKFFIFYDDKDHQQYLSILEETQEQLPYYLHSYCLMNNHIHLLLETKDTPITDIMKNIQMQYAVYFNKRYDLVGHLFQGRFKSNLIEDGEHFLNTSRYIHTNPLEAEITSEIHDYPWSSYPSYFTSTPNPMVTTEKILSYFPEPQKENYLKFLLSPKPKEC